MYTLVQQCEGPSRPSVSIVDYYEWSDFIGYHKTAEHLSIYSSVVTAQISLEQDENAAIFDLCPQQAKRVIGIC